ncbi:FAD/NAD(P)-binding domain-containing protein [Acephala macrosclerotiorum]|nr:FAD/NAD(P)-binding domain-containing protein [Acephala macrosclerotiorum]
MHRQETNLHDVSKVTDEGLLSLVSYLALPAVTIAANVYDYLVVGSAPGGAPVAANLAKVGASVLLLEAGDDQGVDRNVNISAWAGMANNDPLRWDFFVKYHSGPAVHNKYHRLTWKTKEGKYYVGTTRPAGATQLGAFYSRAGTLGGCSMHNVGCSTECPRPCDESLKNQTQAQEVLKSAAKLMGQDPAKIFDLIQQGIFGLPARKRFISDVLNTTNADSSKKYLNFTLSMTSFAAKILFNTTGKFSTKPRAIGVEYLFGQSINPRKKMQAFARNKVIVASGTLNNSQLLKLSGIGPKAELTTSTSSFSLTPQALGTDAATNFTDISPVCTYGASGDPCLAAWHQGKGPYTNGPLDSLMHKTSNAAMNERDVFFFDLPGANPFRGYYPSDTINTVYYDPPSTFDWSMIKIHPTGRLSTVNLVTSNSRDVPDTNFRFFEDADADKDIAAIAEAVDFGRKIFNNLPKEMQPWKEVLPCNGTTTCDMKMEIKELSWSHHATSSAQIGVDNGLMAVLDGKFRVRGVSGLRVVDASTFPRTPGGFPVIPTFILRIKGAESILETATEPWM